jgi:hypothetical protein
MLSKCVPIIVDKWRATWKELSDLIESDGYATFMKPEEYVHLLYGEASFPRSRFYFWAIGCLSAFEDDVTTNIRQLKAFRKVQLDDAASFGKSFDRRMDPITKKLDPATKDLGDIAEQLQKKLAALQALRDGVCTQSSPSITYLRPLTTAKLFSASGVMESRQSRVLGENVRLLTFVSICFLPLGLIVVSTPVIFKMLSSSYFHRHSGAFPTSMQPGREYEHPSVPLQSEESSRTLSYSI